MKKRTWIILAVSLVAVVVIGLLGVYALVGRSLGAIAPAERVQLVELAGVADMSRAAGVMTEAPMAPPAPYEVAVDPGNLPTSADRLVIRNASLTVVVADPAAALDEITRLAEELGGFVVSSNIYQSTFGEARILANQASITLRVPAEDLLQALQRIKENATEVRNETLSGQDVTAEFTDLESRLRNLEAAEAQLREIMASATRTEDVMVVFSQLTQVRGEIEMIRGQMRYYQESAAYSAISVDLLPDVAEQPLQIGTWRPEGTAKEALEDLIRGLQQLGDLAIRFGICGVPFLLIFGLPTWLVIRAIRRRRAKRAQPTS